ncbi:hypothetical protein AB1Y20_008602 [Prymnesium parvum]|uniref:Uncharacterized protein n=1 Tax=Prymnesium parvum TaxID=97485 RepID=A0AB34IRR2_PRYPA
MRAPVPLAVQYAKLDGALAATTPLVELGVACTLALRCSPAELAEAATRAVAFAAGRAGAYALSYERCTTRDVESIEIPAIVASVGRGAFTNRRALLGVTFAETSALAAIAEGAFESCRVLRDVTFEEGSVLTTIGEAAFHGCRAVEDVTLPRTLQTIGVEAFLDCHLLRTMTFGEPSALTAIGARAFTNCGALQSIALPANVKVLESHAFCACSSLERVTLPASLTEICEGAFECA